jgi:hypothetical protein
MRAFSSTSARHAASCYDRNGATAAYFARMETPSVHRPSWNVNAAANAIDDRKPEVGDENEAHVQPHRTAHQRLL